MSLFEDMGLEPVKWMPWQLHSQESADAGHSMKPSASSLRETVFKAISSAFTGLTDQELSMLLDRPENTVRPRRIELHQAGRIQAAGTRRTKSGRQATVWTRKESDGQTRST